MTAGVVFIHQWFSGKKTEKAEAVIESPSGRAARPSAFPTLSLRSETGADLGLAVRFDDALITFRKQEASPQIVETNKGPAHLLQEGRSKGDPVLYGLVEKPQIDTVFLPRDGESDVQMLWLDQDNYLEVSFAIYKGGRFHIPGDGPQGSAIVCVKGHGEWLPVGFYYGPDRFTPLADSSGFSSFAHVQTMPGKRSVGGEFYVLESSDAQYVFSTVGGALCEINLPLRTREDPNSIINPIGADRTITKEYKNNALFPNHEYYVVEGGEKVRKAPRNGGYTPMIRRSLQPTHYTSAVSIDPKYYAMSVQTDDDDELARASYSVKRFTSDEIVMEASLPSRKIVKSFKVGKGPFVLDATIRVDGNSRDLWVSTGVPEVELVSGSSMPFLKYQVLKKGKGSLEKLKLPKNTTIINTVQPQWICNSNGFFGLFIDPLSEMKTGFMGSLVPGEDAPTRLSLIDAQHDVYPASKYPGYLMALPLKKGSKVSEFRLYTGPFDRDTLKAVDKIYGQDYLSAKGSDSWFSFIADPFSKFLYLIMSLFYKVVRSWGLSIILLTVVLRIMMYPLSGWSIRAMKRMQQMQPLMEKVKQKYKNDPKRQQLEMMQLYRQYKANPFSGCLPQLIQLPFLFGMFDLLKTTFELRGASFIPGWITNLSAPDVLFSWSHPIIFFGTTFHLLPFLLGGLMVLQQKMMTKNPAATDQQKQQNKMMVFMLPIVLTFVFYNFPSGLNIYWISSSVLDMLQRAWMNKREEKKPYEIAKRVD